MTAQRFESVAVSTRIRLARNFKDYPFPGKLLCDPHAEEQASEIIRLISAELKALDTFELYEMGAVSDETAAFLTERRLISRDLMKHRAIAAALVSRDESISVMINEEDHIRAQYFMHGFDLRKAYERVSGIDDVISESVPFAFDEELGYLTACPTNLGTGLRASVMLFLPALSRRGLVKQLLPHLNRLGLTVRGEFGEGSAAQGEHYQISNEVTLGLSEEDILAVVERAVSVVVETEQRERARMRAEGGAELKDKIYRSYGVLTNCLRLDDAELFRRIADLKFGVALGFFDGGEEDEGRARRMGELDALLVAMRPANIDRLRGETSDAEGQNAYRAEYVSKALRGMELHQNR